MLGARVNVITAERGEGAPAKRVRGGGAPEVNSVGTIWRRARSDGSYASANDPRVLIGLGRSTEAPKVKVMWPSGRVEEFAGVVVDRYTTLKEGAGL